MTSSFNFTLYTDNRLLSGRSRNDVRALSRVCEQFAGGQYSIEIVQFDDERQRAFRDGVFTSPCVLLELEGGRKQRLGSVAAAAAYLQRQDRTKSLTLQTDGTGIAQPLSVAARLFQLIGKSAA